MGKHGGASKKPSAVAERRERSSTVAERQRATTVTKSARPATTKPLRPPKPPAPMSATQRNKLATQQIVSAIGASGEKAATLATTAALEAVSERMSWDRELQQSVRQKFGELQALGSASTRQTTNREPMPPLIRTPGVGRQTPLDMLDPYELALDYGRDQLRNVLGRAAKTNLKVAVGLVQQRNPGTKPTDARTNQGLVDYIVQHVAGPGY
jgi:hypothetical protein